MPIPKKPVRKDAPKLTEADIDALIEKGGSVKEAVKETAVVNPSPTSFAKPKKQPEKKFPVSMPEDLVDRIDALVAQNPAIRSRNQWILQAIVDKLKEVV